MDIGNEYLLFVIIFALFTIVFYVWFPNFIIIYLGLVTVLTALQTGEGGHFLFTLINIYFIFIFLQINVFSCRRS
jgi:hypothetical protein